jgi:hypothetical protein
VTSSSHTKRKASPAVPAIETLEKMERAMEIPLYQIVRENGNGKGPQTIELPNRPAQNLSRKDARIVSRLGSYVSRMNDRDKAMGEV